jgi:hypothetical protein
MESKIPIGRCAQLRWKGLQIETGVPVELRENHDGCYWCQHTFKPLGPDGSAVDEFECSPARPCYEEL